MMAEKKTFDLTSILGDVSKLDTTTASGAVTSLPAEQIHANDKNFYDVSNVDTLLDAILLDGLQSPLVVNQRGEGDYVIISGHRRFKALQQIIAGDARIPEGKLFAADINAGRVPCFVNHYSSDLEAELALIRANSDTRVLTSAEISKQAERVEMLFYGLKEQGYSFPGKMRNYVAECCKVSASKLARLKVIREKLLPQWAEKFDAGKLNESAAYALSRCTSSQQSLMLTLRADTLTSERVSSLSDYARECYQQHECKADKAAKCDHAESFWLAGKGESSSWSRCVHNCYSSLGKCCIDCDKSGKCKFVCQTAIPIVKQNNDKAKADREKQRKAEEKKEAKKFEQTCAAWVHLVGLCESAGVSIDEISKATYMSSESIQRFLDGSHDGGYYTELQNKPLSSFVTLSLKSGISINKLLNLKNSDSVEPTTVAPGWRTDTDYTPGWCVAQVQMSERGDPIMQLLYRSSYCWRFSRTSAPIEDIDIVAWYPVPERREAQS